MMNKKIPAIIGAAAVVVAGTAFGGYQLTADNVTIALDGEQRAVRTHAGTVQEILDQEKIQLAAQDSVSPALDQQVANGGTISIAYGRKVDVAVDGGAPEQKWTTATTVEGAFGDLGIESDSAVTPAASTAIPREGLSLEVNTNKQVVVTALGKDNTVQTTGRTVGEALAAAKITVDKDDEIKPGIDTPLTDGAKVTFTDVEYKESTKKVDTDFKTVETETNKLDEGTTKVVTEGKKGETAEVWREKFVDGKSVEKTKVKTDVVSKPTDKAVQVGTRVADRAAEQASSRSSARDKAPAAKSGDNKGGAAKAPAPTSPASGTAGTCGASYYGGKFQGRKTANGETFDTNQFTAAHKTLPFGTKVKVTNVANGKTTVVRINDRGPYVSGRCLDLSTAAMKAVGGTGAGVIKVKYDVL